MRDVMMRGEGERCNDGGGWVRDVMMRVRVRDVMMRGEGERCNDEGGG